MVWVIDPTAYRGDEMKDMVLENLSCSGSAASPESNAYILSEAKEGTMRTIVEFVKAHDLFQIDVISAAHTTKAIIKQSRASK
ncbi:unnamed protein product [Prunus armeniaca]